MKSEAAHFSASKEIAGAIRQHEAYQAKAQAIHIKPSHKGMLHKELGVPASKPIPAAKLAAAAKSSNPAERKRAVFAQNAKGFNHSR